MSLPIKLGQDVYCRTCSKILLNYDGTLFIGYTPDGGNLGRNSLAEISASYNGRILPYSCCEKDGYILLETEKGFAKIAVDDKEKIIISGEKIELMISNGKAPGIFMGGGNVVTDARGGCLFSISGIKLRFHMRKGRLHTDSPWDLEKLCAPDPKLYLFPDTQDRLEAVVFVSSIEENQKDDGITVEAAAKNMEAEFETYCKSLRCVPQTQTGRRTAWTLWNALQPPRKLYELCEDINNVIIHGRQKSGSVFFNDSILYSLIVKNPVEAITYIFSFFKYIQPNGFIPYGIIDNKLAFYPETPMLGIVFNARNDIILLIDNEKYGLLCAHLKWWLSERFCQQRQLFYYAHRTEMGEAHNDVLFSHMAPMYSPIINVFMSLWIDTMEKIASMLGRISDTYKWNSLSKSIKKSVRAYLKNGERYFNADINGVQVEGSNVDSALMEFIYNDIKDMSLIEEVVNSDVYAYELLMLLSNMGYGKKIAKDVIEFFDDHSIDDIRQAVTCLLAENILVEDR